jgi:cell wall-associated NlpC family hydrolase
MNVFKFFSVLFLFITILSCTKSSTVTVYSADGRGQTTTENAENARNTTGSRSTAAPRVGYVIQVGAFREVGNASRLSDRLEGQGLDPYYFKDTSNLYKVRFGNFATRQQAENRARDLQRRGTIAEFYIVSPNEYPSVAARAAAPNANSRSTSRGATNVRGIRGDIVSTAQRHIGVPYLWGGTTTAGFDCSGLTQAVYNLNGVSIPRVSAEQHRRGTPVRSNNRQPGDLVFFATAGGRKVNHVGIYIGNNQFIHAPRRGQNVRTDSMSNSYWRKVYVGTRSFV